VTRTQHWQEAFKFALALGLTYMAALAMNWTHPLWAAFSVMTCSLATAGASIERGILRLAGTLAGCALGIVLVALVGHSRWLMFSIELLIIMTCTAGAMVSRFWYAWLMIAFVNVLVVSDAYPHWELSFEVGIERTSETALGIVMYMLVSSLLWPRYTGEALERCVTSIWDQLIRLYDLTRSERESGDTTAKFEQLRSEFISTAATFDETLPAALVDTPSLHGRRTAWHAWRAELAVFVNALIMWRGSFRHIRGLPLGDLVPGHRELELLVKKRLASASRTWQSPTDRVESTEPDQTTPPPEPSSRRLPHTARLPNVLQRAAVAGFVEELYSMSRSSADLLAITKILTGVEQPSRLGRIHRESRPTRALILDRDTVVRVARPAIAWALAFLAWIYLEGLPGGPALLPFVVALSISASFLNLPDLEALAKPYAIGVVTAAPVYFFVLPRLESPFALFVVLVAYSLPWGYAGSRGNFFGKVFGILPLLLCAGITNEQSYSFEQFAGSILVIGSGLACISLAGVCLPSSRPECVLLRNLRDLLMCSAALSDARAGVLQKDVSSDRRASRALRKVIVLAHRVRDPAAALDAAYGPGPRRDRVRQLMSAVDLFAHRLEELEAATHRTAIEAPEVFELVQTLCAQIRSDHVTVFREWARMAHGSKQLPTLSDLQMHLAGMESHLDERGLRDLGATFTHPQLHCLFLLAGSWRILAEATSRLGEAIDALDSGQHAVLKL
jgi:Fusaric acid resistance protein family